MSWGPAELKMSIEGALSRFRKLPGIKRGSSSRLPGPEAQTTFPSQVDQEPGIMKSHWAGVPRGPVA